MKLTVIEVDNWAALYRDNVMVYENHDVPLDVLEAHAHGEPFILEVVSGYDTGFDEAVDRCGRVPKGTTLDDALFLVSKTGSESE